MGRITLVTFFCIGLACMCAFSQDVPDDELQVNFNTYFDNFRVNIVYPSIAVTKKVSEETALTGRYLIDIISAASMKSRFDVDGITSATGSDAGGGDDSPDEVRQEFGAGVTQAVGSGTVAMNALYSSEHDYTSFTLTGSLSYPFAKKNTILQLGVVRSTDRVFPQTRLLIQDKDVVTLSGGLTQTLGKKLIMQANIWRSENRGFLSDAYQVVSIIDEEEGVARFYEPAHPDSRTRHAASIRFNYRVGDSSSLQFGYRYYSDDWEINAHTVNALYQRHISDGQATMGIGMRGQKQSAAFFFQPRYTRPEKYMTVDSKLNSGYTAQIDFHTTMKGAFFKDMPVFDGLFNNPKISLSVRLNVFLRHTDSPDWHSRLENLYAYILSIGYRYRW